MKIQRERENEKVDIQEREELINELKSSNMDLQKEVKQQTGI